MSAVLAAAAAPAAASLLINVGAALFQTAMDADNAGINSLTAYGKTGRISSRVYIDASIAADPVVTDILKTAQTQYCGFILAALQMDQLVTTGKTVSDLIRVVATEDNQTHKSIVASFGIDSDMLPADRMQMAHTFTPKTQEQIDQEKEKEKEKNRLAAAKKNVNTTGKVVAFDGDAHLPAGKIIEITMINPANPDHRVTINLLVQLAPYIVPEPLAVQFICKDTVPSFMQRLIQWKTGEISFWKDFILGSDIVENRARLLKMDPSGVFADMMHDQQGKRSKSFDNLLHEKDNRARNIANSVLIFSQDTVTRAKAASGVDIRNFQERQKYFAMTFAMMIIVVDNIYNQVTMYYNGITDVGTFSFEQMKLSSKGGSNLDLVSVMNALSQGKSPKF